MIIPINQDSIILISPKNQQFIARAEKIALKIGGKLILENEIPPQDNTIIIFLTEWGISIGKANNVNEKPVFIDFSGSKMQYRQKNSGTRKEAIARAVGLKSGQPITILDATAGLGGDSFILAALGANMLMLERNPLIHLLLEDALLRARDDMRIKDIIGRMELIAADSILFLDNIEVKPDVIYMDPMFPGKTKTAKSKKEMHLFREIAGADSDIDLLFTKALQHARKRVVIKRPRTAPYVNNIKPGFDIAGASSRFDVYLV